LLKNLYLAYIELERFALSTPCLFQLTLSPLDERRELLEIWRQQVDSVGQALKQMTYPEPVLVRLLFGVEANLDSFLVAAVLEEISLNLAEVDGIEHLAACQAKLDVVA